MIKRIIALNIFFVFMLFSGDLSAGFSTNEIEPLRGGV